MQRSLREHGLLHYGESHEIGRAVVADGMEMKKWDDIPMGAMWTQRPNINQPQYGLMADNRESASVAHLYGKKIAAGESMTAGAAPFAWSPETLKPSVDEELLQGINQFVIHCSVHQPLENAVPGLGFGPWGQWFTRNETWAEDAGGWMLYLARNAFMMQQGLPVTDILYFYGEDSNATAIFGEREPDVPNGYGYDLVNADALVNEVFVKNGHLATKGGASYRMLVLDQYSRYMSLPVLRKIQELVDLGAIVVGPKPINTPSLADSESAFTAAADRLWSTTQETRRDGQGRIFAGETAAHALRDLKIPPDFTYDSTEPTPTLKFSHRRTPDADIYLVDNRSDHIQVVEANFRTSGMEPTLWYAETGHRVSTSYRIRANITTVPLQLEPWGTVFVVFGRRAVTPVVALPPERDKVLASMDGPWRVSLQGRGAPAQDLLFERLTSWDDNPDPRVKYFSGSAVYSKTVTVPSSWLKHHQRLWFDLGEVKDLARVTVNGRDLGVIWHSPFRVDVTKALQPGSNRIEIKVTNLWINRLIGDAQIGTGKKYTFTLGHPYQANSPLERSGLLGPVAIVTRVAEGESPKL